VFRDLGREGIGADAVVRALGGAGGVLGDVARGSVAQGGVAVVHGGAGQHQGQAVGGGGESFHGGAVALGVLYREGDGGGTAGGTVIHLENVQFQPGAAGRFGGNDMGALDGG